MKFLSLDVLSEPVQNIENNNYSEIFDFEPSSFGGGCLITTATYRSEFAPQVQQLREL